MSSGNGCCLLDDAVSQCGSKLSSMTGGKGLLASRDAANDFAANSFSAEFETYKIERQHGQVKKSLNLF